MNATCENLAYYIHTLAGHGGQYMEFLKSLGKHMNEGVEHHHKQSWAIMDLGFRGGAAGNPYSVKLEDGTFVKAEGPAYTQKAIPMAEQLMVEQSRLMFFELGDAWHESLWESFGLNKPNGDNQSVLIQSPQVQASKYVHRRRAAEKKYEAAVKESEEGTLWSWVNKKNWS